MVSEGHSIMHRAARRLWRSHMDGKLAPDKRSTVSLASSEPAMCFRHDMDGFSPTELRQFLEMDRQVRVPSTCFFLRYQIDQARDVILDMRRAGYDVELHSEARPMWTTSATQLLWLVEAMYRRNLRGQVSWMRKRGFDPRGHAPHSVHNYLGFQNWIDWNVIEQATIGSGLSYISDWRGIARTPEGSSRFPEPMPPFFRSQGLQSVLVIPTAWDDKFFFASYEDRVIRGSTSSLLLNRTIDDALLSIEPQMSSCFDAGIPLVINLHPIYAVRGELPLLDLKKRLVESAAHIGMPVLTLRQLCTRMAPC